MSSPLHVVISGAGPAGLLLALLLSKLNIPLTIIEKSSVPDPWTSKSYSINLNERGLSALDYAGVLETAQKVAMKRSQVVVEMHDGSQTTLPKTPPHYAFARPHLVTTLEKELFCK